MTCDNILLGILNGFSIGTSQFAVARGGKFKCYKLLRIQFVPKAEGDVL